MTLHFSIVRLQTSSSGSSLLEEWIAPRLQFQGLSPASALELYISYFREILEQHKHKTSESEGQLPGLHLFREIISRNYIYPCKKSFNIQEYKLSGMWNSSFILFYFWDGMDKPYMEFKITSFERFLGFDDWPPWMIDYIYWIRVFVRCKLW